MGEKRRESVFVCVCGCALWLKGERERDRRVGFAIYLRKGSVCSVFTGYCGYSQKLVGRKDY